MKFKILRIEFSTTLTRDQEDVLIANFKGVVAEIEKELGKKIEKLDSPSAGLVRTIGQGPMLDTIRFKLDVMRRHLGEYFYLTAPAPGVYEFKYAWEELSVINQKMNLLGKTLRYNASVMPEKKLVGMLRNHVFKDMNVPAERVKITFSEEGS